LLPCLFFCNDWKFRHRWQDVTAALWQKYPNPFAAHVLTNDVIERFVDPETGRFN